MPEFRGTTILSVRRDNQVVIGGDGQVSLGNTVMKGNAKKVRRLYKGAVIAGFAGSTADASLYLSCLMPSSQNTRVFLPRQQSNSQKNGVLTACCVS